MGSAAIPLSFESPKFQPIDPLGASAKAMSLYSAAQGISLNQQRIAEETLRAKQLERDQRDEDIGNETLAKYDGDLEKALPELSTKVQAKNALKWRQAYRADKQAALALTREQQAAYQGYFDAHAQEDAILASLPPEERANRIPQSIAGLKLAGVPKDMIQYKEGEVPSDAQLKARIVGSKVGSRIMADAQKASAIKTAETRAGADVTTANTRASAEKRAALLQTAEDVGAYLRTAKDAEDFDAKFAKAEEAHPEVIDRFPDKWSPTANDEIDAALSKGQARIVEFGKRAAQGAADARAQRTITSRESIAAANRESRERRAGQPTAQSIEVTRRYAETALRDLEKEEKGVHQDREMFGTALNAKDGDEVVYPSARGVPVKDKMTPAIRAHVTAMFNAATDRANAIIGRKNEVIEKLGGAKTQVPEFQRAIRPPSADEQKRTTSAPATAPKPKPVAAPTAAPPAPSPTTAPGTVRMRAPTGQTLDVSPGLVEHYKSKGAVVVGQ